MNDPAALGERTAPDETCSTQQFHIGRVVDLSLPLDSDTQVYPGYFRPTFEPARSIKTDGFNELRVSFQTHSATHIDAPYHFKKDGMRVRDLDPATLVGPLLVVDLRDARSNSEITWSQLAPYEGAIRPGVIVAFNTGWSDRYYRSPTYFNHPYLQSSAYERLLMAGIRTFAVDTPSLDVSTIDGSQVEFPVHHLILCAGGVIAENLTKLDHVDFPNPFLAVAPVLLGGDADGAPARAIAMEVSCMPSPSHLRRRGANG